MPEEVEIKDHLNSGNKPSAFTKIRAVLSRYFPKGDCHLKVFICYSRKDQSHLDDLYAFLRKNLPREVNVWYDVYINIGEIFEEVILKNIKESQIAILLESENFFKSEFIRGKELPVIIEEWRNGLTIFRIIISPCGYRDEVLESIQAANNIPLTFLNENQKKTIYKKICDQIKKRINPLILYKKWLTATLLFPMLAFCAFWMITWCHNFNKVSKPSPQYDVDSMEIKAWFLIPYDSTKGVMDYIGDNPCKFINDSFDFVPTKPHISIDTSGDILTLRFVFSEKIGKNWGFKFFFGRNYMEKYLQDLKGDIDYQKWGYFNNTDCDNMILFMDEINQNMIELKIREQ